jgi:broad specificity phosphatase PhoE
VSTLTLLRHGQAAFGAERYDDLSTLGAEQARATGAFFASRGLAFTRVISGPRHRHQQTARWSAGTETFEIDASLDEFAEGEQVLRSAALRTGMSAFDRAAVSRREQLRMYADQLELWAQGWASIDGAVPPDIFRARVSAWLSALTTNAQSQQQNVLAVTSAGVIAAVVCDVLGQNGKTLANYMQVLRNASMTTLLFSGSRIALQDFNATQHLPLELVTSI